jgi:hypothetical protein
MLFDNHAKVMNAALKHGLPAAVPVRQMLEPGVDLLRD